MTSAALLDSHFWERILEDHESLCMDAYEDRVTLAHRIVDEIMHEQTSTVAAVKAAFERGKNDR